MIIVEKVEMKRGKLQRDRQGNKENKRNKIKMIKINNRLIYSKIIEKTRTDRVDKEKIYKAGIETL